MGYFGLKKRLIKILCATFTCPPCQPTNQSTIAADQGVVGRQAQLVDKGYIKTCVVLTTQHFCHWCKFFWQFWFQLRNKTEQLLKFSLSYSLQCLLLDIPLVILLFDRRWPFCLINGDHRRRRLAKHTCDNGDHHWHGGIPPWPHPWGRTPGCHPGLRLRRSARGMWCLRLFLGKNILKIKNTEIIFNVVIKKQ